MKFEFEFNHEGDAYLLVKDNWDNNVSIFVEPKTEFEKCLISLPIDVFEVIIKTYKKVQQQEKEYDEDEE
jgi:hypothetical protein